jgi:hypothetical protein
MTGALGLVPQTALLEYAQQLQLVEVEIFAIEMESA